MSSKSAKPLKCKYFTAQTIVQHVYTQFCAEANRGYTYCSIKTPKKRVIHVFKKLLSRRTISRLLQSSILSANEPQRLVVERPLKVDNLDRDAIKRLIVRMFEKRELVTLRKTMQHIITSLRRKIKYQLPRGEKIT